jgi:hypothetical protein
MRGLVAESNRYLRKIKETQKTQLTLFDSIKREKAATAAANKKYAASQERLGLQAARQEERYGPPTVGYRFEEPPADLDEGEDATDMLNATLDSDLPADPLITKHMAAGKISFGDADNLNTTLDYRTLAREEGLTVAQYMERCHRCLTLAWSLGASHVGAWMADHETILLNVVHNTVRLFSALLHQSRPVRNELTGADKNPYSSEPKTNKKLVKVLKLYQRLLHLLQLDHVCKHMQVVALKLAQDTVQMLLTNPALAVCESRRSTYHGAVLLLRYTDAALARIYCRDLPRPPMSDSNMDATMLNGANMFGVDMYEPCVGGYTLVSRKAGKQEGAGAREGAGDRVQGGATGGAGDGGNELLSKASSSETLVEGGGGGERSADGEPSSQNSVQRRKQQVPVGCELHGFKRSVIHAHVTLITAYCLIEKLCLRNLRYY